MINILFKCHLDKEIYIILLLVKVFKIKFNSCNNLNVVILDVHLF